MDKRLERAERDRRAGEGSHAARVALVERMRRGVVTEDEVRLSASLGSEEARRLFPNWDPLFGFDRVIRFTFKTNPVWAHRLCLWSSKILLKAGEGEPSVEIRDLLGLLEDHRWGGCQLRAYRNRLGEGYTVPGLPMGDEVACLCLLGEGCPIQPGLEERVVDHYSNNLFLTYRATMGEGRRAREQTAFARDLSKRIAKLVAGELVNGL